MAAGIFAAMTGINDHSGEGPRRSDRPQAEENDHRRDPEKAYLATGRRHGAGIDQFSELGFFFFGFGESLVLPVFFFGFGESLELSLFFLGFGESLVLVAFFFGFEESLVLPVFFLGLGLSSSAEDFFDAVPSDLDFVTSLGLGAPPR